MPPNTISHSRLFAGEGSQKFLLTSSSPNPAGGQTREPQPTVGKGVGPSLVIPFELLPKLQGPRHSVSRYPVTEHSAWEESSASLRLKASQAFCSSFSFWLSCILWESSGAFASVCLMKFVQRLPLWCWRRSAGEPRSATNENEARPAQRFCCFCCSSVACAVAACAGALLLSTLLILLHLQLILLRWFLRLQFFCYNDNDDDDVVVVADVIIVASRARQYIWFFAVSWYIFFISCTWLRA